MSAPSTAASPFTMTTPFNEVFAQVIPMLERGDGIIVSVLQTRGLWNYLYYKNTTTKEYSVNYVGVDRVNPVRYSMEECPDRLAKWDKHESFGTSIKSLRKHMKTAFKNAHGNVALYSSSQNKSTDWIPVKMITFSEPEDYEDKSVLSAVPAPSAPNVGLQDTDASSQGDSVDHIVWGVGGLLLAAVLLYLVIEQQGNAKP